MAFLPRLVGVVGAGQMGAGIAQVMATGGLQVVLSDQTSEALSRGLSSINRSLERLVKKGDLSDGDATAVLGRIATDTHLKAFSGTDLVIEAVTEQEPLKRALFGELDRLTQPACILASNTSSISITRLSAATRRPEKVVGLHFMNPPPLMKLIEVVKGKRTSEETFEAATSLAAHLGRTVCVSADRPGFIVNRLLMPMINEAFYCLMEGVGSPEHIDIGMRLGANQPMGPLRLADYIGLDTCLAIMNTLHQGLGDPKYRPCPLLIEYVDAGWLGDKTGRGVYEQPTPQAGGSSK